MYEVSDGRPRGTTSNQTARDLPILFHLVDVSRPRAKPEVPPSNLLSEIAVETSPSQPVIEPELSLPPLAAPAFSLPPERISFVDALRWLATAKPGDELPDLVINPLRPGRHEPRVRKRRPKNFPLMKKPRAVLRQELLAQSLGA